MLSYDYLRQEHIRRFLNDSRRSDRIKSIVNDGCILVYELLVIALATRLEKKPEAVKKKHSKLKPLARAALTNAEDHRLRDVILEIADVRNAAAHEPLTDDAIRDRFHDVWKSAAGSSSWQWPIGNTKVQAEYSRALFALIAFELGRWQVGLDNTGGHLQGVIEIDWRRFL